MLVIFNVRLFEIEANFGKICMVSSFWLLYINPYREIRISTFFKQSLVLAIFK